MQAEWSKNLRELGIVPVFPPREDVFVGDIYLSSFDPDSGEVDRIFRSPWSKLTPQEQEVRRQIGMWTRWFSLDLSTEANEQYRVRPAFPVTGEALSNAAKDTSADSLTGLVAQPTTGTKGLFLTDRENPDWDRVNRARLVAFPDFSATAYNQADLKALIPIEAFSVGLNGSYADFESATVKIPVAESYSVSVQAVLSRLAPLLTSTKATESQVGAQITSATVQEYRRLVRQIAEEIGTNKFDTLLIPQLFGACKESLEAMSWEKQNDPALDDTAHLRWFNDVIERARRIRPGDYNDSDWLKQIRRFDQALEPTFIYRRKLGRAASRGPVVFQDLDIPRFGIFAKDEKGPPTAHLRVITEVFYARALDISIAAKRSLGLQAGVALIVPSVGSLTNGSLQPKSASPTTVEPKKTATPPVTVVEGSIPERVAAVQSRLDEVQSLPGGRSRVISVTDRAVGVRRIFERPVAVGFRSVTLSVDLNTGFVVSGNPSGGAGPLVR